MDVLDEVLGSVRARAACSGRLDAAAPWGIEVGEGEARFYVVLSGRVWLRVGPGEPIELDEGDLLALPRGAAHALLDSPTSRPRPVAELLAGRVARCGVPIAIGSAGPRASLVVGQIAVEDARDNPLLLALPEQIVLRAELRKADGWLEPALRLLDTAMDPGRSGGPAVMRRLGEFFFVEIVRAHLGTLDERSEGWLAALTDRQVGAALTLVHKSPEREWTVRELALAVAMSRSAFAARFTRLVGEPPLHYVTRRRMQKAKDLLRQGRLTIAEVAGAVGYDSEAAFSKAFKRAEGRAPGAFRRAVRGAGYPRAA
jgi:AraC-like DNA-binding protein